MKTAHTLPPERHANTTVNEQKTHDEVGKLFLRLRILQVLRFGANLTRAGSHKPDFSHVNRQKTMGELDMNISPNFLGHTYHH